MQGESFVSQTTLKKIALALIPSVAAVAIFGLGMWAGRYLTLLPFKKQIANFAKSETLGRMLTSQAERQARSLAYYDSQAAQQNMDNFSWAVPNVLTPFVGNGPRPGQSDNAFINSMQFRSTEELQIPKAPNTYRIFLTGGSTAFGSGAPSQEQNIAGYLNQILNRDLTPISDKRYEVFTAANPAWASTHERILIENRLSELEPDMVISFSGNNDVHWGRLGRNILWFRSYSDQFFWDLVNTLYKSVGYDPMPEVTQIAASPVPPPIVAEHLRKNIELSNFVLAAKGARYVFVLQPTISVSSKDLTARERAIVERATPGVVQYFGECYKELRAMLAGLHADGFSYVDLSDAFAGLTDKEEIFLDSYHFGDRGYEIVAKRIAQAIRPMLEEKH